MDRFSKPLIETIEIPRPLSVGAIVSIWVNQELISALSPKRLEVLVSASDVEIVNDTLMLVEQVDNTNQFMRTMYEGTIEYLGNRIWPYSIQANFGNGWVAVARWNFDTLEWDII